MPAKYRCTAVKPPAGEISSIIDSAENEDDAIRQFRQLQNIENWETHYANGRTLEIEVQQIEEIPGSANQMASEQIAADKLPASPQEAIQQAVAETSAGLATARPGDLDLLANHGLDDRQLASLQQSNLSTINQIIAYAKGGGKFAEVKGLTDSDTEPIRKAIQAARNGGHD